MVGVCGLIFLSVSLIFCPLKTEFETQLLTQLQNEPVPLPVAPVHPNDIVHPSRMMHAATPQKTAQELQDEYDKELKVSSVVRGFTLSETMGGFYHSENIHMPGPKVVHQKIAL